NGRTIDVDETIVALVRDLRGDIASALAARRALLERAAPVREKYAWPSWDETFADPVGGASWTFRQIVQGLIDNGSGRSGAWRWRDRAYEVTKKGQSRSYRIARPPSQWPTRFVRPPGIHVRFDALTVDAEPSPGLIVVAVLWVLNNFVALTAAGTGIYFYIPKI